MLKLPGDVGTVQIPSSLHTEMEDESTLLVWVDGCDDIYVRFSSLGFSTASGEFVAKSYLRDEAVKKGLHFREHGDLGITAEDEREIEHDGEMLLHSTWMVGARNTLVLVSVSILRDHRQSADVNRVLKLLPAMLESIEITRYREVVRTDERDVEVEAETVESTPQSTREFGAAELDWLNSNEQRARELSLKYGSGGVCDAEELDRIFARWAGDDGEKEPADIVVNALGAAFGSHIVESLGFRWVVLSDEHGTEFAVRHSVGDATAFPRPSIEKRIQRPEMDFFQKIWLLLKDRVVTHPQS